MTESEARIAYRTTTPMRGMNAADRRKLHELLAGKVTRIVNDYDSNGNIVGCHEGEDK